MIFSNLKKLKLVKFFLFAKRGAGEQFRCFGAFHHKNSCDAQYVSVVSYDFSTKCFGFCCGYPFHNVFSVLSLAKSDSSEA